MRFLKNLEKTVICYMVQLAIKQDINELKGMQAAVRANLLHVPSSVENNWHYSHCQEGKIVDANKMHKHVSTRLRPPNTYHH